MFVTGTACQLGTVVVCVLFLSNELGSAQGHRLHLMPSVRHVRRQARRPDPGQGVPEGAGCSAAGFCPRATMVTPAPR